MLCVKCGFENPEDTTACQSCGLNLSVFNPSEKTRGISSSLASFSFLGELWGLLLFFLGLIIASLINTVGMVILAFSIMLIGLGFLSGLVSTLGILFSWDQRHALSRSISGLLLGGINVFLLYVLILNLDGSSTRSPVARVKGDMRTMTIALETYYLDFNTYPAWSVNRQENAFGGLPDRKGKLSRLPTFRSQNGSSLATLTTPISYITSLYSDPFSPIQGATFCYWGTSGESPDNPQGTGYILWSPGPDGVYDLTMDNIAKLYVPTTGELSPGLLNLTYDPSNGTTSRGDVYRTKM